MGSTTTPWLATALVALAGIIAATVAVCTGHIGESTFIALVGPILGGAAGAGIHAAGVQTTPAPQVIQTVPTGGQGAVAG